MESVVLTSWFSASQLAKLGEWGVIPIPTSIRRASEHARKHKWPQRKAIGKGGRGGARTEYMPPDSYLSEIHRHLRESPRLLDTKRIRLSRPNFNEVPQETPCTQSLHIPIPLLSPPSNSAAAPKPNFGHIALDPNWLHNALGASLANVVLARMAGDSMHPTLSDGDSLLVNAENPSIDIDAIYAFQTSQGLVVKRVQRKLASDTIILKNDNPEYENETLSAEQAKSLTVIGKVIWCGKKL